MAKSFDREEKWLTSEWVGRALKSLGFEDKRRVGSGVQYYLTRESVEDLAKRLVIEPEPSDKKIETVERHEGICEMRRGDKQMLCSRWEAGLALRPLPCGLGGKTLSVKAKLSFTYDDTPVTIELQADSLSTLDSLKWLIERVASWIDEGKRIKGRSE